jgi:hypothetical protein
MPHDRSIAVAKSLRALVVAAILAAAAICPADARSLRVAGTSGYLSEWELKAEVTATQSERGEEFSGPLTLRHVGLCSPNGAKNRHDRFHISKSLWCPRSTPRLIDGRRTYNAKLSDGLTALAIVPAQRNDAVDEIIAKLPQSVQR